MSAMPHFLELGHLYTGLDVNLDILYSEPENDDDFLANYLPSKLWRLNNLYTIVDKVGEKRRFVMNLMQHKIHAEMLRHPRVILLKSRQIGGSTYASITYLDDAIFIDNLSIGLMAQGNAEAATLLERVKLAWEEFPKTVKDLLGLEMLKDNRSEIAFSNGSTIFIRTSFRSATLHRLWISEFAKISVKYPERARETVLGTLQAIKPGNPVLIESTAERGGEYQRMWNIAADFVGTRSGKDFAPLFIGWTDDPSCILDVPQLINREMQEYFADLETQLGITLTNEQKWFYVAASRELNDAVTQEYPSTPEEAFAGAKDGAYYAKLLREHVSKKNRIVTDLWEPELETYSMFDLGVNDLFTIIWFQIHDHTIRLIDCYSNSGEGFEHYVDIMFKKPYQMSTSYLPHDAKHRSLELPGAMTRQARLRELGLRRTKVLKRTEIATGIEQVRRMIPYMWFDEKCLPVYNALMAYTKEWDDVNGVWKNKPKHDENSHYSDTVRGIAMSGAAKLGLRQDEDHREFTRKMSEDLYIRQKNGGSYGYAKNCTGYNL